MQQNEHEFHSSSAPECVPKESPLYLVEDTHQPQMGSSDWTKSIERSKSSKWMRWPFLLVGGVFIAVVAGLIGGFIGKAIETSRHSDPSPSTSVQNQNGTSTSSGIPSSTPTSEIGKNGPSSTQNATELIVPKTGCPYTNDTKAFTDGNQVPYTLFCNVDWIGSDIAAISAHSISDCVEACNTVNQYGLIEKECIGATFVPQWINKTIALAEVNRPSNCFLKYEGDASYPRNRRPFEVAVICLEGKCP